MSIRIIIFETNQSVRESLSALINAVNDFKVIGAYGYLDDFRQITESTSPHVVIMDINFPAFPTIEAIREIKATNPAIQLVIYTACEDESKVYDCLCAGADGYILKSSSPIRLLKAISQVVRGGAPMSPTIAKTVLSYFHKKDEFKISGYDFTTREKEVLQILVQGYSVKHIAGVLDISFDTCRSHLRNIYKKLEVNCGKEAIAKILQEKNILN